MKTPLTLKQEELIYQAVNADKIGLYCSFEVAVKENDREYIDFMTMDSNETIRCYEIKSSMEDFKSKAAKTFIGDFNYYVMPDELYEKSKRRTGVGSRSICDRRQHNQKNKEFKTQNRIQL